MLPFHAPSSGEQSMRSDDRIDCRVGRIPPRFLVLSRHDIATVFALSQ
jgi:hypothetical protein